jgi:hypothetical protein
MIATTVVAIVGIGAFTCSKVSRRAHTFQVTARYHARLARMFAKDIRAHEQAARAHEDYGGTVPLQIAAEYRMEAQLGVRFVVYHERLRRKYENAAARPWCRLAPDPPEPRMPP